jgi:6-phosphogluconolactonase (cycloisomerase 2 family)
VAAAAVATAASPAFASASNPADAGGDHAVFVQTDNTEGNRVVAYDRAADGTLTPAGSYATGGRGGFLARIPGSHRALGLDPNATPQFTTTPGQVAFTPDGTQLVVTTKGNGNAIDVFGVGFGGRLSAKPTVNSEPGTVPFAIAFDPFGHLAIAEAGPNALATFDLSRNGTVSLLSQAGTGQAATCWVTLAGSFLFASNAGTPSESGFTSSASGQLSLLANTATDPGAVDAASAAGGRFLYVQTGGNGIVDEFSVAANGALTKIGAVLFEDEFREVR